MGDETTDGHELVDDVLDSLLFFAGNAHLYSGNSDSRAFALFAISGLVWTSSSAPWFCPAPVCNGKVLGVVLHSRLHHLQLVCGHHDDKVRLFRSITPEP